MLNNIKEICFEESVQELVRVHESLSRVYMTLLPDIYLDDELQTFKNDLAKDLLDTKCQISDKVKELLRGV